MVSVCTFNVIQCLSSEKRLGIIRHFAIDNEDTETLVNCSNNQENKVVLRPAAEILLR